MTTDDVIEEKQKSDLAVVSVLYIRKSVYISNKVIIYDFPLPVKFVFWGEYSQGHLRSLSQPIIL